MTSRISDGSDPSPQMRSGEWRGPSVICHFFIINYSAESRVELSDNTQHIREKVENERRGISLFCECVANPSVCRAILLIVKYILSKYGPSVFCILRIWWINMESKRPTTPTLLLHCPDAKYIAAIFRDENSNTFYVFITTFSGKNTRRLDERGCKCKRDFHSLTFSVFIILLFMICSFRSVKIKFINVGIWLHTPY